MTLDLTGERRERALLIAFVDLMGFARQCAASDDAQIAEVVDGYYQLVAAGVTGAGGHVVKYLGDGVLAVFDAADVDRGALALLALADEVDGYLRGRGWPCHATVKAHLGTVVAGPFGGKGDERFDVIGKAVNLAAMLDASGVTLSAEAFAALAPATQQRFTQHAWPTSYIRAGDTPRFRR